MENNTSTIYYNEIEHSKNTITYEFKPELVICNNDSESNKDLLSRNSSQTKENQYNNLDNTINKLLSECNTKYKDLFVKTMIEEYIEDGYMSSSQKLYEIIQNEYGTVISSLFFSNIYMEYALNNKIIKSLLYIMARLNPKYLNGIDMGIIAFALSNEDYEIRDLVLQCFEKWNDKKYLALLKSLKLDVDFLQEYLNNIISELESER